MVLIGFGTFVMCRDAMYSVRDTIYSLRDAMYSQGHNVFSQGRNVFRQGRYVFWSGILCIQVRDAMFSVGTLCIL
jgi:hypothetical protein